MDLENTRFEVLTIDGFKDFDGYLLTSKETWKVSFEDLTIECTPDHKFYSLDKDEWVEVQHLNPNERIRTQFGPKQFTSSFYAGNQDVVDLIDVKDTHSFYANGIDAHNCLYLDEFAFVRPNIATEFWTSIQPVLATGGSCIITSTPKNDEDQFAQIWKGANDNVDEYGNLLPGGSGSNGFFPIMVKWDEHPDRDENWAKPFRASLGIARFSQEFECCVHATQLNLTTANGLPFTATIGDLYAELKQYMP